MNWKNILKMRNRRWHSPLDKIMSDGEKRTAGQALGLLIDYYENKTRKKFNGWYSSDYCCGYIF